MSDIRGTSYTDAIERGIQAYLEALPPLDESTEHKA